MPALAACPTRSGASSMPSGRPHWARRRGFPASRRPPWWRCCAMSGALMRLETVPAAAITNAPEFQAVTGVSRETAARLEIYAATLARWQTAINLVGRGTLETVWQPHLLDSAQLLAHLPEPSAPLVDLGSGAGFPGLVLAILGAPDV